eukprot:613872-Pelagomonas_calceolata.AAC.2
MEATVLRDSLPVLGTEVDRNRTLHSSNSGSKDSPAPSPSCELLHKENSQAGDGTEGRLELMYFVLKALSKWLTML